MKKIIFILLMIIILIIPFNVKASGSIKLYEVNANINEDGTVDINEHIKLSSKMSLSIENNYLNSNGLNSLMYVGMDNDFYGSDIYSSKLVEDALIKDNEGNKISFETLKTSNGLEYHLSDVDDINISYVLDNLIVDHPDASEFYYDFFKDKFDLVIENAIIKISLPKSSSYLKATDYEYLNNADISGNRVITFKYSYGVKDKNIRVLFDKGMVETTKKVDKNIRDFVENDINNGFIDKIKYYVCIGLTILFYLIATT